MHAGTEVVSAPVTMAAMPIDAGAHPRYRRRSAFAAIAVTLVALLLAACSAGSSGSPGGGAAPPQDASGRFVVTKLGLRFSLPASFAAADDPDLAFLARSRAPLAIFSIAPEAPDVVDHEPESGEVVSDFDLPGTHAVLIKRAVVGRLPTGIEAYELLVAHGERSFSVILSAQPSDLARLWSPFAASLSVR